MNILKKRSELDPLDPRIRWTGYLMKWFIFHCSSYYERPSKMILRHLILFYIAITGTLNGISMRWNVSCWKLVLYKFYWLTAVVRWTDRPAMTIAVDLGRKATKQTIIQIRLPAFSRALSRIDQIRIESRCCKLYVVELADRRMKEYVQRKCIARLRILVENKFDEKAHGLSQLLLN